MHPHDFGPPQLDAIRNILLGAWKDMSAGDLSLVLSCRNAGSGFLTVDQAPLDRFLQQLEVLGWVERSAKIPIPAEVADTLRAYELTEDGAEFLSTFIEHYRLMNCGEAALELGRRYRTPALEADHAREQSNSGQANRNPVLRLLAYAHKHSTLGRWEDKSPRPPSTWRETFLHFVGAFSIMLVIGLVVSALRGALDQIG
jgi:hypothetical protein